MLDPVTLVEPAVLYSDDRHVVWHAGVILGPSGKIAFGLEIESPTEGTFRVDPAWQLGGPPPIDAYIEPAGEWGPIGGSMSLRREKFAFGFQTTFQPIDPERLAGAELHIKIHPLGQHLVLILGPE